MSSLCIAFNIRITYVRLFKHTITNNFAGVYIFNRRSIRLYGIDISF